MLSLSIDEGNRESDVDIDKSRIPTNAPPLYDVLLSSFEVKSHTVDRAGIAECFSNMIGVDTRIATDILQGGNLVETINVYRIVISMVNPLSLTILFTSANLQTGQVYQKRLVQDIKFPLAFSLVLTKIKMDK